MTGIMVSRPQTNDSGPRPSVAQYTQSQFYTFFVFQVRCPSNTVASAFLGARRRRSAEYEAQLR